VGHVEHAHGERDPGDDGGGEHRAPAPAGAEEDVVQDVGEEDPGRDRELLEDDESTADLARRQLGDVGGDDHRRGADGDAHRDAEDDEENEVRGQRRGHCAHRVERGEGHQRVAAADGVGHLPGEDAADDGADQDGRDRELLAAGAEMPLGLEQVLRAGDDADVVAEQHPTDGRDRGHQVGVRRGGADDVPAKRAAKPSVPV
jgi:hypothetical protein